jgi:hypothetical protein
MGYMYDVCSTLRMYLASTRMGDEKREDVLTNRERHALGHAHSTQHFGTVQILILKTHYTQQYLTHSKKLFLIANTQC